MSSAPLHTPPHTPTRTPRRVPSHSTREHELLAEHLLDQAVANEQAVHELCPGDQASELRAQVRTLARQRKVKIRTGLIDGVVAVILADASLWSEPVSVMRNKLTPSA